MKKTASLTGLYEISEDIILEALTIIPDHEESGLREVMAAAEDYKMANMTPMFIMDEKNRQIFVVAKETFGKKLS